MHCRLFLEKRCRIKSYCAVNSHMLLAHGVKLAEVVQSILCVLHCQSWSWRIQDEALLCNLLLSAQLAKCHFLSRSVATWPSFVRVEIPQCDLTDLPAVPQIHEMCVSTSALSCKFQCSCIIMIVFCQFIIPIIKLV